MFCKKKDGHPGIKWNWLCVKIRNLKGWFPPGFVTVTVRVNFRLGNRYRPSICRVNTYGMSPDVNFEIRQLAKYFVAELASVFHPAIFSVRIDATGSILHGIVFGLDADDARITVNHFNSLELLLLFGMAICYVAIQIRI